MRLAGMSLIDLYEGSKGETCLKEVTQTPYSYTQSHKANNIWGAVFAVSKLFALMQIECCIRFWRRNST